MAQRLRTETDRRGRKGYGKPWDYYGYSDIDQLEFPEFSPGEFASQSYFVELSTGPRNKAKV